jgi:hypothetical protein
MTRQKKDPLRTLTRAEREWLERISRAQSEPASHVALHNAPDGLPEVSEDTIRTVLREAGFSWQRSQTWCKTGQLCANAKGVR